MAKRKVQINYKCSNCNFTQPRWLGRCPECGSWNTMEECINDKNALSSTTTKNLSIKSKPISLKDVIALDDDRISTGIKEFDRVLGGLGATKKSAILLGGEPGIGKSTLLLQTASSFSNQNNSESINSNSSDKEQIALYVSGEESTSQIKARANRLGINCDNIQIMSTMRLEDIIDALNELKPLLVIIDSIQTVYSLEGGIIPGTINQLKYCTNELVGWVKENESILIMTCHVTKDGNIAGPKALEHMVDTVISFERNNDEIRFLRAYKNRFGSVDELGIFRMSEKGLIAIEDPSTMFITRREGAIPNGVAIAAVFEGTRVFLVEIQALTVPAKSSITRVFSEKIDSARVSRIAAVLEKRTNLRFSDQDIYINVAGGVRLTESAIDSALAASLYSARTGIPLSNETVLIGELSLAGEIRPVGRIKQRAKTALSLGYKNIIAPESEDEVIKVTDISGLVKTVFSSQK